jgi:hypothetical protein
MSTKILNPKTGRFVKPDGCIGRKLLKSAAVSTKDTIDHVKINDNEAVKAIDGSEDHIESTKAIDGSEDHIESIKEQELTSKDVMDLFKTYRDYVAAVAKVHTHRKKLVRKCNFPSDVSENLVRFHILKNEQKKCIWLTKKGDLLCGDDLTERVEVKCFCSTGPSSFGPDESWDHLYFVDATAYLDEKFKIFRVVTEYETFCERIFVNKKDTFRSQCDAGRRPRLTFSSIKDQLQGDVVEVFDGTIQELLELA